LSTPFLLAFSEALVARLLEEGEIELVKGREMRVVEWLAGRLNTAKHGQTLISLTGDALIQCDDVIELWADNARIKELVEDLRA